MASEQSQKGLGWWLRHPAIATAVGAAGTLSLAAIALWLHVGAVPDSPRSQHVVAGDFVFFGMFAALILLAGGIVISRQRRR